MNLKKTSPTSETTTKPTSPTTIKPTGEVPCPEMKWKGKKATKDRFKREF